MYTLHMQENICGQVKLRIYDVQDEQRLSPQDSLKEKFQTNCYHYLKYLFFYAHKVSASTMYISIASTIFVLFMFPLISERYPGNKNMLFLNDDIHLKRDNECRLCTIHIVCPPITHHRNNLKQMSTPDNL